MDLVYSANTIRTQHSRQRCGGRTFDELPSLVQTTQAKHKGTNVVTTKSSLCITYLLTYFQFFWT